MASNRFTTFKLTGGEDRVTPDLDIPDGVARNLLNYEQNYTTGYTRVGGYRHLVVGTVPGEGAILGTVIYDDFIYIFRNQVGGASTGMWLATPAVYDDTVSPATVTSNGSWTEITDIVDSVDAATTLLPSGYYEFVIHNFKATADADNYRGDYLSGETYSIGDIVTDASGDLGTVGLLYECDVNHKAGPTMDVANWTLLDNTTTTPSTSHDISGDSGNLYGTDGINPAFEFNGTQLKQIDSTYTPDVPMHIEANGNRLALGFRAGELAMSVLGDPFDFNPVYGAGSIGVTDFLTGMMAGPDGVMYVFAKDKLYLLKGMGGPLDQAELTKHSKSVGSYPYTSKMLAGSALFYDEWGLTSLEVTQRFGDVVTATLTNKVQSLLTGLQPITSVVRKDRAQYRLYLATETGVDNTTTCLISTVINNEDIGITHAVYPFQAWTSYSSEVGLETVNLVGTKLGEVFEMDVGTNFNGASYLSYMLLPYNHLGTASRVKKLRKVKVHIDAIEEVAITGRVSFDEGSPFHPTDTKDTDVPPSGAEWNNAVWGNFIWNAGSSPHAEYYFNGHFEDVALTIQHESATTKPHVVRYITYIHQDQRIEH